MRKRSAGRGGSDDASGRGKEVQAEPRITKSNGLASAPSGFVDLIQLAFLLFEVFVFSVVLFGIGYAFYSESVARAGEGSSLGACTSALLCAVEVRRNKFQSASAELVLCRLRPLLPGAQRASSGE